MDIAERAQALALKIRKHKDGIETEEATKNAFVMPFISTVLGYDVFNPAEVIPEFTADVGTKRGEKIDYAIVHNGQVQVLVEAKKINDPLRTSTRLCCPNWPSSRRRTSTSTRSSARPVS